MEKVKKYFTIGFGTSLGIGAAISLYFILWVIVVFFLDILTNGSSNSYCNPSSRYCDFATTNMLLVIMQTALIAGVLCLIFKMLKLGSKE